MHSIPHAGLARSSAVFVQATQLKASAIADRARRSTRAGVTGQIRRTLHRNLQTCQPPPPPPIVTATNLASSTSSANHSLGYLYCVDRLWMKAMYSSVVLFASTLVCFTSSRTLSRLTISLTVLLLLSTLSVIVTATLRSSGLTFLCFFPDGSVW